MGVGAALMKGQPHAATGAAGGVASLPVLPLLLATPHPAAVAVWVGLATIGALLPDLDEPRSTVGRRSLGAAHIVRLLAGGHREGTHDIVFAPCAWLVIGTLAGVTAGNVAGADPLGWWWVGVPLAIGVAVGILGDSLTVDGVPVPGMWALPGRTPRWGLRLFRTGNALAEGLVVALSWVAAIAVVVHVDGAGIRW